MPLLLSLSGIRYFCMQLDSHIKVPKDLIGMFRDIFFLSISRPSCSLTAAEISFVETEPKVRPPSPAFILTSTIYLPDPLQVPALLPAVLPQLSLHVCSEASDHLNSFRLLPAPVFLQNNVSCISITYVYDLSLFTERLLHSL